MYELLITDICENLANDLRYKHVSRVRVNPRLYHEFSIIVDKIFHETNSPVYLIEDPLVNIYKIE